MHAKDKCTVHPISHITTAFIGGVLKLLEEVTPIHPSEIYRSATSC
mgnify:CR=1 FL=1